MENKGIWILIMRFIMLSFLRNGPPGGAAVENGTYRFC